MKAVTGCRNPPWDKMNGGSGIFWSGRMLWGGWEWIVGGSVATLVRPPRFFPLPFLSVFSVLPLRRPWRGFFLAVLWDMEEEVLVGSGARPRVPQYSVGRVCIKAFPPPPDPFPVFSPSPGSVHCAACVPIIFDFD